jgi:uncharacterized protein (TIGR04255 family)
MFSKEKRCIYENNQLAEVVCQLRFPEILSIGAKPPVDFQEIIRSEYPRYSVRNDAAAPKITGTPGDLRLENGQPTVNYQFVSQDGTWRVNLTNTFLSLTCTGYKNWETFAKKLDLPLAALIRVYKPAFFERIGLRYMNFFSRKALELEGVPYHELFTAPYLGILCNETIRESDAARSGVDAELAIPGGCRMKLHAGPGLVKRNGQADSEPKFILDMDLYMGGNIPLNHAAAALETIHQQSYPVFRDAITDRLHEAMEPEVID